jgi:hypothetical protein
MDGEIAFRNELNCAIGTYRFLSPMLRLALAGAEDSNLRMAESKSVLLSNHFNVHLEKIGQNPLKQIQ